MPGPAWVGEPPYENDYLGNSAVEQPVLQCAQDKGLVVNPTWSQDSGSVAYGSTDGIHVMAVPADWSCAGPGRPAPRARGGSEPDWGPADVEHGPEAVAAGRRAPRSAPARLRPRRPAPPCAKVKLTPATFRARAGAKLRFTLAGPAKLALTVDPRERQGRSRAPSAAPASPAPTPCGSRVASAVTRCARAATA